MYIPRAVRGMIVVTVLAVLVLLVIKGFDNPGTEIVVCYVGDRKITYTHKKQLRHKSTIYNYGTSIKDENGTKIFEYTPSVECSRQWIPDDK